MERRSDETEEEFSLRKAIAEGKALEQRKAAHEEAFLSDHPADTPLTKFARVWEGESNSGTEVIGVPTDE